MDTTRDVVIHVLGIIKDIRVGGGGGGGVETLRTNLMHQKVEKCGLEVKNHKCLRTSFMHDPLPVNYNYNKIYQSIFYVNFLSRDDSTTTQDCILNTPPDYKAILD